MKKQLIFTHVVYNKGIPNLYYIEKKKDHTGKIAKEINLVENPDYHFYVSDKGSILESKVRYTDINNLKRVDCKYGDLYEAIANTNKSRRKKKDLLDQIEKRGQMRKMHDDINVFQSDIHIEDYAMMEWERINQEDKEFFPLTKGYFDIEVDTGNFEGFPDEEEAPCPVNLLSYLNSETMTLYGLALLQDDNDSQLEFFKNNFGKDLEYSSKNNEWCKKALEEHFSESNERIKPIEELKLIFFLDEMELIEWFFKRVNKEELDFIGAWNAIFDLKTLEQRIIKHKKDPVKIMTCKAPYRKVEIIKDNRTDDIRDRSHTFNITSKSIFTDMTFNYAAIRKPEGMKESYSLEYTLQEELGESKFTYEGDIKDAVRENYELFLLYSLYDSYRLYQLEQKTKDIDSVFLLSDLSSTRFSKSFKKTTMIRNFVIKRMNPKGIILSNNLNVFSDRSSESFEGAFVSSPLLNRNTNGMELNGVKVNNLFEDCIDMDFSSLYPMIMISYNIDSASLLGRIITEGLEEFGLWISEGDIIKIGHKTMNLPSMEDLLDNLDLIKL